jgi:hypothetical protein
MKHDDEEMDRNNTVIPNVLGLNLCRLLRRIPYRKVVSNILG